MGMELVVEKTSSNDLMEEAERREFTPQMQKFLLAVAGAARSARVGFDDSQGGKPRNPNDR